MMEQFQLTHQHTLPENLRKLVTVSLLYIHWYMQLYVLTSLHLPCVWFPVVTGSIISVSEWCWDLGDHEEMLGGKPVPAVSTYSGGCVASLPLSSQSWTQQVSLIPTRQIWLRWKFITWSGDITLHCEGGCAEERWRHSALLSLQQCAHLSACCWKLDADEACQYVYCVCWAKTLLKPTNTNAEVSVMSVTDVLSGFLSFHSQSTGLTSKAERCSCCWHLNWHQLMDSFQHYASLCLCYRGNLLVITMEILLSRSWVHSRTQEKSWSWIGLPRSTTKPANIIISASAHSPQSSVQMLTVTQLPSLFE